MHIRKFWRRLTTTRHARTLEAELALERAVIVRLDAVVAQQSVHIDQQSAEISQQGIEIARLRAENRALLNSILGIAGVPPLPATDADLAALQSSLCTAAPISPVGARHVADPAWLRGAVPERDAGQAVDHSAQNEVAGDGFRTAGLRPAQLPFASTVNQNSKTPAGGRRYTNQGDPSSETNGAIQPSSIAGHGSAVPLLPDTPAADFRTAGETPAVRKSQHHRAHSKSFARPRESSAARGRANAPPFLAPNPPPARIRIRAKRKARRRSAAARTHLGKRSQ